MKGARKGYILAREREYKEYAMTAALERISAHFDQDILPVLAEYIRIPNQSPMFDSDWQAHGHMDRAMDLLESWCRRQPIQGITITRLALPERTPLLFMEIAGSAPGTVLLYGHMDKQPEMVGWDADKGPWQPVRVGDKLYGRGGADDGYAVFAALTAIAELQAEGRKHARCVVIIEGSEESGSPDLPAYLTHFQSQIGTPDLVICLDSGCGNYDQLWCTTSLRGTVGGLLTISVLTQGVHSGLGSGIVPSCSQVLRQILDRIENSETGMVLLPELHVNVPPERLDQAQAAADVLGEAVYHSLPFQPGVRPVTQDITTLLVNRSWRPQLSVTGAEGLPPLAKAGNVTLPSLSVRLSMRIPPLCHPERANQALTHALCDNPPFGAHVSFVPELPAEGWNAPTMAPWLLAAAEAASHTYFGRALAFIGEGGTIPFMAMLGNQYPKAQFFITGVLGPQSNAHGPNEFLHIPTVKRITACVMELLGAHALSTIIVPTL